MPPINLHVTHAMCVNNPSPSDFSNFRVFKSIKYDVLLVMSFLEHPRFIFTMSDFWLV